MPTAMRSALRTTAAGMTIAAIALAATTVRAEEAGAASLPPASDAAPAVRTFSDPRSVYLPSPEARELGAQLRAAGAAAAEGRLEAAAERYAAAAVAYPDAADRVHWLHARALLEAGRAEAAADAARRGLAARPRPPALGELQRLLGDARHAAGDEAGARAAWLAALSNTRGVESRAPVRLEIAESLLRDGLEDEAVPHLRKIWVEAPQLDEAERAGAALDRIDAQRAAAAAETDAEPATTREGRDFLRRADRLYRLRYSEGALADYERALALGMPVADALRAREQRAHTLFRLRRYPEAVQAFTALGDSPDHRVWRARALARSDRVEQSIDELEALGQGSSPTAAWARYLAALLHEGRDREGRAEVLFASTARAPASDGVRRASLWRLGWLAHDRGDESAAREHWLALAARESDPVARLEPRFWAAHALAARDPAAAAAELREIADAYPLTYYGWRARARVGGGPGPVPEPLPVGRRVLTARDLLRAQALLVAGETDAAVREAEARLDRVGGVDDRVELARLLAAAGDFHGAQRLVVDAYGARLAEGPHPGQEEVWRLAWPAAYVRELMPWLRAGLPVEPELVLAVMREESGYRPQVISITGALGLMQIMPGTGERLARDAGVADFHPERLLEPELNLRLGSFYLSQLSQRFGGSRPAAIAGYNAGPEVVSRWLDAGSDDVTQWIASIPYTQTRAYVMRVLRSVHAYRVLYP